MESGGKGGGRNVQQESFQIPRHLNIRTNSSPSSSAELGASSRPLELASVDQRTDTNRGCIQRALARPLSLFLLPSRLRQRGRTQLQSPCHSFPSVPLLAARSTVPHQPVPPFTLSLALFAQGEVCVIGEAGERQFHRKAGGGGGGAATGAAAVSGAASFYVLRPIVNTVRPGVAAFIRFSVAGALSFRISLSRHHSLSEPSTAPPLTSANRDAGSASFSSRGTHAGEQACPTTRASRAPTFASVSMR